MRCAPFLLAFLTLAFPARVIVAQEARSLPPIVQQQINDETILVARLELGQSGANALTELLGELPDPTPWFGMRIGDYHKVLTTLQTAKLQSSQRINEIFVVISTSDLPVNNLTLVIPVSGTDADRKAVAEALKTAIGPKPIETVTDGIILSTNTAQTRDQPGAKSVRPEFVAALATVRDSHLQVAISLSSNARRVLREFWPTLPVELGGGSSLALADGWKWMALGMAPSLKPDLKFIVQSVNGQSAEELEKIVAAALKWVAGSEMAKSIGANSDSFLKLLATTRQADQLAIVITGADVKQQQAIDEFARPLLARLQRNALRSLTNNNLKQLLLGMHNYHDTYNSFPSPATRSPDGKKLLSWRVALLPWLDNGPLYKEFHLDEPWDSEHNRKLIARMPEVYASANTTTKQRAQGLTTYLGLNGDKTVFSGPDAIKIKQIKDGTSNTIAIVDAVGERAVIWTQPEDLVVDMKDPLNGLAGQVEGLFRAAMCDGSVRAVRYTLKPENLRRLFQIDDGEVIDEEL